jgi:hypothetical protein
MSQLERRVSEMKYKALIVIGVEYDKKEDMELLIDDMGIYTEGYDSECQLWIDDVKYLGKTKGE